MNKLLYILLVGFLAVGCQKEEAKVAHAVADELPCGQEFSLYNGKVPADTRSRALSPAYSSFDDLGAEFVKFLNKGDKAGLKSLLVTEREFTDWIFPEYNIANPNCGIPSEMIFESLRAKSLEGISVLSDDHFYQDYEYERMEFTNSSPEEVFETYNFFNRTLIYVKNDTEHRIIAVPGSVLELNQKFKFLSYRENDDAARKK